MEAGAISTKIAPCKCYRAFLEGPAPFDGNLIYWVHQLENPPLTWTRVGKLLNVQRGRCAWCGLYFQDGDRMEADHK